MFCFGNIHCRVYGMLLMNVYDSIYGLLLMEVDRIEIILKHIKNHFLFC